MSREKSLENEVSSELKVVDSYIGPINRQHVHKTEKCVHEQQNCFTIKSWGWSAAGGRM